MDQIRRMVAYALGDKPKPGWVGWSTVIGSVTMLERKAHRLDVEAEAKARKPPSPDEQAAMRRAAIAAEQRRRNEEMAQIAAERAANPDMRPETRAMIAAMKAKLTGYCTI